MASASSGSFEDSPAGSTAPSTSSTSDAPADQSLAQEKPPDDSSKLRMFLGILRKFIGVTDIASVRFSLPSQLLEPTPNLEYWNYLDQPSTFVAIGDSDDELGRMLEVLRFWFTKDLKYVKGKPCKPYNSALGEFFRCNWEVEDAAPPVLVDNEPTSPASSVRSGKQARGAEDAAPPAPAKLEKPITVSYLTEQTSHHPPVSAFYVDCPAKGLTARGFDQLSAKFTGTSIRVTPGEHNLGIFITLAARGGEQYQLTHPAAHLGGLLRGSLSVTVGDVCYVTCARSRIKTILHYAEEGWLGKTQNRVDGVVFRYDPDNDDKLRIRDVPDKDILARTSGNWREKIYYSLGPKADAPRHPLINLLPLTVAPKQLPPPSLQLPNESLRFWGEVTAAIAARQFSRATTLKQELEERQREGARARAAAGTEWTPRFFVGSVTPAGRPELTEVGREVLKAAQAGVWGLEGVVDGHARGVARGREGGEEEEEEEEVAVVGV